MINLGTVRPGSTIRIPFSSFDKDDGSSITMTNFAAADILVYKDGDTTERASTSGFTATTDFDSKTGKHIAVINLADNTTAGFFTAGSEYLVAIDAVTIDSVTTGGWIARFVIGYQGAMIDTTIATLSSQTSFTLTSGPAEDNALVGCEAIIHDIASAVQLAKVIITAYTGSTKTVTLATGATFTVAAGDNISILMPTGNMTHVRGTSNAAYDLSTNLALVVTILSDLNYGNEAIKNAISVVAAYVDTEVAAIKSKTDNLPSDPADASDIAASFASIDSTLATIAAYIDTEVAAIKAKTDNLPASPANEATLTTIAGYLDTEIAAIKASTDNLPSDPADASVIAASFSSIGTTLADLSSYVDTEVAAIKAKTDNLPASPANEATLTTIAGYLDTEVAAIKAKTDNLPSDPADHSIIMAAIAGISGGGGGNASPTFPEEGCLWRFEANDEMVASNKITQIVGFAGLLGMEWDVPLPKKTKLSSARLIAVSPDTGLTLDDGSVLVTTDNNVSTIPAVAVTAGTYTVVLEGTSTDGQKFLRRGVIEIETLMGT